MLALESAPGAAIWTLGNQVAPEIVEALLACGAPGEVHEVIRRLARALNGRDAPAGRAGLAVCRALLEEAGASPRGAARWLAQAERILRRLPCPYEAARARERRGRCLLAAEDARGGECLLDALREFERLGASWDSGRTRAALRVHGVRLPYPWRGGRRRYGEIWSTTSARKVCNDGS